MEIQEDDKKNTKSNSKHLLFHRRKRSKKRIITGIIIFVAFCIVFALVSRLVFHRSAAASIAEILIKIANNNELATKENAEEKLEKLMQKEEEPYKLGWGFSKDAEIFDFDSMQVIAFGDKERADNTVIYLHGGAYVDQINDFHMIFCDKLAKETNSYVLAPLYPLLPRHTYDETYPLLEKFYNELIEEEDISMIGDSAGGGLAAAFCEYLNNNDIKQPEHLILFSPWVDVSMTLSDYSSYEAVDPMLELEGTIVMGKAWAGKADTKNYLVSPYYGEVEGLTETTIFVGTREILYPDVIAFYDKLREAQVDATLYLGEGMNHIYPIYPLVPESNQARQIVYDIITGESE